MRREAMVWTARGMGVALGFGIMLALGVVGALLAVPIAAGIVVVLERLKAREIPVAQEPGAAAPDSDTTEELGQSLPDTAAGARAG